MLFFSLLSKNLPSPPLKIISLRALKNPTPNVPGNRQDLDWKFIIIAEIPHGGRFVKALYKASVRIYLYLVSDIGDQCRQSGRVASRSPTLLWLKLLVSRADAKSLRIVYFFMRLGVFGWDFKCLLICLNCEAIWKRKNQRPPAKVAPASSRGHPHTPSSAGGRWFELWALEHRNGCECLIWLDTETYRPYLNLI